MHEKEGNNEKWMRLQRWPQIPEKREKIKTPFAKIIVGGTAEKPYYMICYYDTNEKQFVVCCGSYNRDFVFQWLTEDFENIDNGGFDAVPVVHGWWLTWEDQFPGRTPRKKSGLGVFCSACHNHADNMFSYCPNCGAKMDAITEQ